MSDSPDLAAVTGVQQQIWSKGDFAMVANLVYNGAEDLAEALDLVPDERVARRRLRQRQRARSPRRGAPGGARSAPTTCPPCSSAAASAPQPSGSRSSSSRPTPRSCPSRTATFDVAMSIFGAMFAPDQPKAAAELLRVVKPGGRIGMANWTPDGAVGTMFKTIAKHAPPPPGHRVAAALGHRGAHAGAVRRRDLRPAGRAAASRASRSARPITTSSSSAPTSAPRRWPTNGSGPTASRR